MDFSSALENSFWVVPLVVAIVQVFKMTGVSGKWSPLISLGVGIGLGFLVGEDHTIQHILLSGVIYGLSASGLYSGVTSTQKISQVKSGQIPLSEADTSLLTKEEILEIQKQQEEKKQAQQQAQQQSSQQGQQQGQQKIQQEEVIRKESTIIKP
jgi:hypothetical protein